MTPGGADPAPTVSVVIPSHGRPELLRRAVATAAAQRGVDLEIVVIDDGSPVPATEALADAARGNAQAIRIVRHDTAQGVARARNRGIAEARGTWIALLDDDDLWSPDKLRLQLDAMQETGCAWSHTGTYWLTGELAMRWSSLPDAQPSTAERLRLSNFVGTPSSVVMATTLARQTGGFDASFSVLADWDMWLRLAAHGPGAPVREALIGYMTHDDSMHRQDARPIVREQRRLSAKHRATGRVGGALMWRWIADTAASTGQRSVAIPLYVMTALRFRDRGSLRALTRTFGDHPPQTPDWAIPVTEVPDWIATWATTSAPAMKDPAA